MYHVPSDPGLICIGKKRKIRFPIQQSILGFFDLLLRFKRLRNDFFFHHLFQHHCRICGRIFCNNCSNNWLQTPHSRYWSCHLILAVHRDQVIVVRLLQTRPFDKNLCELTQKTPIKQTNSDKLSLSACYRLQTLLIVQTRKNPWSICKEFACVSLFGVVCG